MPVLERIREVAEILGYEGAEGFVDDFSKVEPGSRDVICRDMETKCGVDAVYFRGAVPMAAFVEAHDENDARSAHRRLWNYGRVPVLIAVTGDQVSARSCVVPPGNNDNAVNESIMVEARTSQAATVLEDFRRFKVESGRALLLHDTKFRRKDRVDQYLLKNLRVLKNELEKHVGDRVIEPLLGRSIFVKYLEDRGILGEKTLNSMGLPSKFAECLEGGWDLTRKLFTKMAQHFNGDVFRLDALPDIVPNDALSLLADFFQGANPGSVQRPLWSLYDFSVIPSELISSIYEQLLKRDQKNNGAYYTPRSLVGLIMDELLPWDDQHRTLRILDPACGSGIFLSEAFRRLAYRQSRFLGRSSTYKELSELLTSSIYGVDLSPDAIGVSAFSLYLALLENVEPRTIWDEARLPNLVQPAGPNLSCSDFFDTPSFDGRSFDLVVGNPPWMSSLSTPAREYVEKRKAAIADKQIAWAFIWKSADLVSERGRVGLVVPAKSILHNLSDKAKKARRALFSDMDVDTVVDLSDLRKVLFRSSKVPAAVLFFRSWAEQRQASPFMVHVAPRRTPLSEVVEELVIPQQDIMRVQRDLAQEDPGVWKQCLYGGSADMSLIQGLRHRHPSLAQIVDQRGWLSAVGFTKAQTRPSQRDSTFLREFPLLQPESFRAMRSPSRLDEAPQEETMYRPGNRSQKKYRAPHILLRRGFSDSEFPEVAFLPMDASFSDAFLAIAGEPEDADDLRVMTGVLASSVARYWYFMSVSSWGIERPELKVADWLSLPVPTLRPQIRQTILQSVQDAYEGEPERSWRSRLDAAVESAYDLTNAERQLIADGIGIKWDEFAKGKDSEAYKPVPGTALQSYCDHLEDSLTLLEMGLWDVQVADRQDGFVLLRCRLSIEPETEGTLTLDELTRSEQWIKAGAQSPATIIEPCVIILRGYTAYLAKPDQLRCWTPSVALSDASDIFGALLSAPTEEDSR